METTTQYVDMMIASLNKKITLLDKIIEVNQRLEAFTAQPSMDLEVFRQLMDEKDSYVQEINQLDTGFQDLFNKVKEAIDQNRQKYREQIRTMQQRIREITDRTVKIEKVEAELKLVIEGHFAKMRREAQTAKKGMNVAQNYYKSMARTNIVEAQFMDKKN